MADRTAGDDAAPDPTAGAEPGGGARPGPGTRLRRWQPVLKWGWIVLVVTVAVSVLVTQWRDIAEQVRAMSVPLLLAGLVLTVLAKLALGENARVAAVRNEIPIGFETAARLYNLSQLGKYLPGSVWQFVGRATAYRTLGAGYGRIRDAILTESLWVVAGALVVGVSVSGAAVVPVVVESLGRSTLLWLAVGLAVVAVLGMVAFVWRRETVLRYLRRAVPTPRAVVVQLAIWALLGAAFWSLARAADVPVPLLYAVGLFAAAYAVGFLVLFVPAGLGVRDTILVLGLLPYTTEAEAIVVVLLARAWYVLSELLLVGVQEVTPRLTPVERLTETGGA